ncbi:MAG: hypothetical protein OXE85_03815 [Roseovarius sp.]|nr:hypothetical protein [Roseovarius sp.]
MQHGHLAVTSCETVHETVFTGGRSLVMNTGPIAVRDMSRAFHHIFAFTGVKLDRLQIMPLSSAPLPP